jgi:hypothetical protein
MRYILKLAGPKTVGALGVSRCEALRLAINQCPGVEEEEGGFLISRDDEIEFHKIVNKYSGTPTARGLYEPDRIEYGNKIIAAYSKGFINYASFHTHPTLCPAKPSQTDLTRLFNGQPVNFIWSPSVRELNMFTFVNTTVGTTTWLCHEIDPKDLLN